MSPLEKMARAIERELDVQEMILTDPFTLRKMMANRIARAALLAIREPERGSPIIEAMFDRLDDGQLGEDYSTSEVWRAGIDAILNQEPRP